MNIKDIKTELDLEEWLANSELGKLVQHLANNTHILEEGRVALLKEQEELRRDMNNLTERLRKMVN